MKNYLFIIIALLCNLHLFSQSIEWEMYYGGSSSEYIQTHVQTNDGGYIFAGVTFSDDEDVVFTSDDVGNIWLVKTDESGNMQWEQNYGGSGVENVASIRQTSDGGYIIGSWTESNDGDVGVNYGSGDFWVIKIDADGNIEWEKSFGGSDSDQLSALEITNDGGYILGGHSKSSDGDVGGNYGGDDFWVVKIDDIGNILWEKNFGGSSTDVLRDLKQTDDGGYILGGSTFSNDGDIGENYGNDDFWVVKINAVGELEWEQNFGGSDFERLYSLQQTNDGGFILGGTSNTPDGDVSSNNGSTDFWIVKIDGLGNLEWEDSFGGSADELLVSIEQTNDNGYILSGHTQSSDNDVTTLQGFQDLWVVKTDSDGNLEWEKTFGHNDNLSDIFAATSQTADNGFIIVGSSWSNRILDFWAIKISNDSEDNCNDLSLTFETGCTGPCGCTFSLEVSATGGDGNYTFTDENGQIVFNGMDYDSNTMSYITVTDGNGCSTTSERQSVALCCDILCYSYDTLLVNCESNGIATIEVVLLFGNDLSCGYDILDQNGNQYLNGDTIPDGFYIFEFYNDRCFLAGTTQVTVDCFSSCDCPDVSNPVCGIDGITYDNPCLAECAGITDYEPGSCSALCDLSDLSLTYGTGCSGPCGCNGILLISATGGDGNYTFTDESGQVVFNEMDSDSTITDVTVTDGNGCSITSGLQFVATCCDAICYDYNSLIVNCEPNGIATIEVILDFGSLGTAGSSDICGYDILDQNGNQYQNGDTIPDGFYIFEFYNDRCSLEGTTQVVVDCFSSCNCPDVSDPVCGTDGITYDNPCLAECAGVLVASLGSCSTDCNCSQEYIPVCGSNGNTYSNACFAECDGITDYDPGSCSSLCDLGNLFTYEYVTSIGTDDVPQSYAAVVYCFQENLGIDNICGWNWDFGNGTTSTEADPCGIIFDSIESGEPVTEPYLVCLTVSDCNGFELGTCCEDVYLNIPPVSNFPDFPWLDDIVDVENCCGNTSVTQYSSAGYSFIYIKMGDGCDGLTQLYLNDGTFYCTSSNNFDCYEAYSLNLLPETVLFACNNVTECNCPEIFDPVCGTDGITYDNECLAECAGATIDYFRACITNYPSDTTLTCLLPNQIGTYCPTILDGYSITYYNAAFPNCTVELIDDCLEYHGFPGEYVDYLEALICNDGNDCYQVVYQIATSNECIIEPYNCEMQEECTEALTPIILCPEFCAFNNQNYSIQDVNSFYTACSITILDDFCFRYIPLPQMENYGIPDSISVVACNPIGLCDTIGYVMNIGNCPNEEKLDQTEVLLNTEFDVYPNPNNGLFYISLITESLEDQTVSIYDLTGKIIETYTISAESRINNIQVNMSDVSSGMYFVEWRTATQHSTERIIIE